MIVLDLNEVAYGEEDVGWWNSMAASFETFEFEDWLAPGGLHSERARDLYNLVHRKMNSAADDQAMKATGNQYGMTVAEVKQVIDGSISPIFNSPTRSSGQLTIEDATKIMVGIQEDYRFLKEVYQIQQEVDVAIKPSELFANGDIADSGFDLVVDLIDIELILFNDADAPSVGGSFSGAMDKPYNQAVLGVPLADNLASNLDVSASPLTGAGVKHAEDDAGAPVIDIGGKEIEVEVLTEDVCPTQDLLGDALDNFDDEKAKEKPDGDGDGDGDPPPGGGDGDGDGDGDKDTDDEAVAAPDELEPAPADSWIKPWCEGLGAGGDDSASAGAGIGPGGVKSLGGFIGAGAGAGLNIESAVLNAQFALCLDTSMVYERVSYHDPGDSCIQCELEAINELLEETLSHSLIPNKATGNLFESAKCKETLGAGFSMNIILVKNPVPTPPNDDLIFGKNIFEEWNKFVDRYKPIGYGKFPNENVKAEEANADDNYLADQTAKHNSTLNQSEVYASVVQKKAEYTAQAMKETADYGKLQDSSSVLTYGSNMVASMENMNALFEAFRVTFEKINKEALEEIKKKPNK